MRATATQASPCIIILVLLGLDLVMAIASYKQFGWRMYSKIACDFRTKSGISRQRTYLFIHSFLTVLKVDLLVRSFSLSYTQIGPSKPMLAINAGAFTGKFMAAMRQHTILESSIIKIVWAQWHIAYSYSSSSNIEADVSWFLPVITPPKAGLCGHQDRIILNANLMSCTTSTWIAWKKRRCHRCPGNTGLPPPA